MKLVDGRSARLETEPVAAETGALRQRIIECDCRFLVLEGSTKEGQAEELPQLAELLACDILVGH